MGWVPSLLFTPGFNESWSEGSCYDLIATYIKTFWVKKKKKKTEGNESHYTIFVPLLYWYN